VRIVIVDDSAPFRRAARDLLERRGFEVVGEADGVASGLDVVKRLSPDAVLLDTRLPDGSGLDLCALLTSEEDAPAILLVSSDSAADGALAKAHGARGYVSKADLTRIDLHGLLASVRRPHAAPGSCVCGIVSRMTTWAYTTTAITHGFMGRKSDELDRKELEAELNGLGAEGWELAATFLDVSLHREKDGHVLVFKRRAD
jgi:DNA-binding NarL/FixJ family response regulator